MATVSDVRAVAGAFRCPERGTAAYSGGAGCVSDVGALAELAWSEIRYEAYCFVLPEFKGQ